MKRILLGFSLTVAAVMSGQIYAPDGLRMPGDWNGFANSNPLGTEFDLTLITSGERRYQTTFEFTGTTGSQAFKFASGSAGNPWANEWRAHNFSGVNSLEAVGWMGANTANNTITITNGRWYTVNFHDNGYATSNVIFMETSAEPVTFSSVTNLSSSTVAPGQSPNVTVNLSANPSAEERVFLVYTTDGYATRTALEITGFSGGSASESIPGQSGGTTVSYYVCTSTIDLTGVTANQYNFDMRSIEVSTGYSYTVASNWATSGGSTNWSDAASWAANEVPASGQAVSIGHNITLNQDATVSSLTINSGITFTASDGTPRTLTISRSASGSATTITNSGGTWANGTGGSTVVFTGAPSSGDAIHATSGALGFQNVTINKTGGTSNVGVDFTTNSSVSGTLQIGEGGFVSTAPPASFYGASAILEFNQGDSAVYNVIADPEDKTWSTTVIPQNITITTGTVNLYDDRTATGDLIVASGAQLVLTANVELEVNGTLDLGGDIDLLAANNGYSQLKVDGAITDNGGAVSVQQYVATAGWHNVAIPVTGNLNLLGSVNTDIHPNTRNVYTWNETTGQWVDVAGPTNGAAVANAAGTGYLVYVGTNGVINSATNFDVTGDLFGNTTPTLTNAGSGDDAGWNLVGNPFPCGINFFSLTRSNVANGYSIWNTDSSKYSAFSNLSPGNPRIPPMQGFWVQATGGSPSIGSISMAANGDVDNISSFLKTQTVVADRFFLNTYEAADPSKRDEFLLGMVAGTHDGLDNAWDIGKRMNASTVPSLMSVANGQQLAINAIDYSPNHLKTKKLQLRFVSGKANEVYFIELDDALLSNNYHIELEDLKLRRKHNLKSAPYKFVHDQNAEYRFVLHISPVTTINQGHTHTPVVSGGVNVGINGGMLVLKMDAPAQDVSGALLDLNGRRVMEVEYPAGVEQHLLDVSSLAKGIYLLQLQSTSGEEVHKIILP